MDRRSFLQRLGIGVAAAPALAKMDWPEPPPVDTPPPPLTPAPKVEEPATDVQAALEQLQAEIDLMDRAFKSPLVCDRITDLPDPAFAAGDYAVVVKDGYNNGLYVADGPGLVWHQM